MPRYGYIRLDKKDNDVARQASQLDSIGKFDRIIVEQRRADINIPSPFEQLDKLISQLKPGDLLYAASLDRFCSQTKDFIERVDAVLAKKAHFICLEESFDTRAGASRNVIKVVRILASIDKITMSDRKKDGIRAARDDGRRIGRPPVSIPAGFRDICKDWSAGRITGVEAISRSGMKSTSFYKKAAELGYIREKGK
ncbi:MAG: recombinase family protein [Saccharofermentanales bacterium]